MREQPDNITPSSAPAAASRGALLRTAREAAGVSREDVAARLRLSLRQVQALEDDELDALPPGPFVKGFVRNYARMLDRDPLDFEPVPPASAAAQATGAAAPPSAGPAALPSLTPPQPQRQVLLESGRASANRRWLVAAVVFLALGVLGSWLRTEHLRKAGDLLARQAQPSLAQLGALVGGQRDVGSSGADAAPVAPPAGGPVPGNASDSPGRAAATAAAQAGASTGGVPAAATTQAASPAVVAGNAAAGQSAAPAVPATPASPGRELDLAPAAALNSPSGLPAHAAPAAAAATAAAAAPGRKLALDFDADCWVEVRDENNQVLWSGLSRAGEHRDFEAHGPVRIVVGNAPATRLSWNGRPVDLAEFTRMTVARLTLDPASDNP